MGESIDYPAVVDRYGIEIDKKTSGKIFFIAEAGTGHLGNLEVAIAMVDTCAYHGVSAIKFQYVIAEEILHPYCGEVKLSSEKVDLFNYFKKIEEKVDKRFWQSIIKRCQEKKILFLSSFFGPKSFLDLKSLGVEAYKVASPEMNYYRLWQELINVPDPVFFSSGIAKKKDLKHLLEYLDKCHFVRNRLVHLHCVTQYPSSPTDYDLIFTMWFEKEYGVLTGLSDHCNDPYLLPAIFTAIKGMKQLPVVIEKHFTMREMKYNIDSPVAINENELRELISQLPHIYKYFSRLGNLKPNDILRNNNKSFWVSSLLAGFREFRKKGNEDSLIRWGSIFEIDRVSLEKILGDGHRQLSASESIDYLTTKRSLLAMQDIEKGELISLENSAYCRSEKNLKPGLDYSWEEGLLRNSVIFKAKRAIQSGEPITENDFVIIS